jgi:hypothetical protein
MKRAFFVAAVVLCASALSAVAVRPEITDVTPRDPAPSASSQAIVVSGREFAQGLALAVTTPSGNVADYRGNAITDVRETSFRAAVVLADAGSYRIVVVNPDGQASTPFPLQVKAPADGPTVREIKPNGLRISSSPQNLTVEGTRFDSGFTVSITDPTGEVHSFGGEAIRQPTPTSFELTVKLEYPGHYELAVVNPNGKASNIAGFDVGRDRK